MYNFLVMKAKEIKNFFNSLSEEELESDVAAEVVYFDSNEGDCKACCDIRSIYWDKDYKGKSFLNLSTEENYDYEGE